MTAKSLSAGVRFGLWLLKTVVPGIYEQQNKSNKRTNVKTIYSYKEH